MTMNVRLKSIKAARFFALPIMTIIALCSFPVHAAITSEDYLCPGDQQRHYMMNIDGQVAHLYFYRKSSPNQSYLRDGSVKYYVYFRDGMTTKANPQPRNQQDVVGGRTGPGYAGVNCIIGTGLCFGWMSSGRLAIALMTSSLTATS